MSYSASTDSTALASHKYFVMLNSEMGHIQVYRLRKRLDAGPQSAFMLCRLKLCFTAN